MKRILFQVMVAAMAVLSSSQCKKEVAPEPVGPVDPPVVEVEAVTLEAEGLSDTGVELKGMVNLGSYDVKDLVAGFQYSESSQFPIGATNVLSDFIDEEHHFMFVVDGLSRNKTYYFRSMVLRDGKDFYGEVKPFQTKVVPTSGVVLDKSNVKCHSIDSVFTLKATVLPEDATDKQVYWRSTKESIATVDENGTVTAKGNGIAEIIASTVDPSKTAKCVVMVTQWVTDIAFEKSNLTLFAGLESETLSARITPDNAFNKELIWSSSNPAVAEVDQEGKVTAVGTGTATITATALYGDKVSASCTVNVPVITDLSYSATANCYILSSPGAYQFKAVKGSQSDYPVGDVASVEVLWESFGTATAPNKGDIVAKCIKGTDNAILFLTPDALHDGNAVIAARDAAGTILWSWHIWACGGYDPESTAQAYFNGAGTVMDRNLGATSATSGEVGALGLLYQWGRKDPFLSGSSISSSTKAASTIDWPETVYSSPTTEIVYSIQHPTTFIGFNSKNYDWLYTGSKTVLYNRWLTTSKSMYDPCPAGWRVPVGGENGVWAKAARTTGEFTRSFDGTHKGINFNAKFGSADPIWFPATGYCDARGDLTGVGVKGRCWTCTPTEFQDINCISILTFNNEAEDNVNTVNAGELVSGYSVRCVKE